RRGPARPPRGCRRDDDRRGGRRPRGRSCKWVTWITPVRERRRYLLLLAVIVAALVGALMISIPGSPAQKHPTLGLDLKGGLEVVLQAQNTKNHKVQPSDLDTAVSIMQQRINGLGISEPEIRKQEPNQIVIQLAGIHDPQAAAKIIGQTAQLELYDL